MCIYTNQPQITHEMLCSVAFALRQVLRWWCEYESETEEMKLYKRHPLNVPCRVFTATFTAKPSSASRMRAT